MKRSVTLTLIALLTTASPAIAGGIIATPALEPPSGGSVRCIVANVSDSKSVTFDWRIYDYSGTANWEVLGAMLGPLQNSGNSVFSYNNRQSHCVISNIKGGRNKLRVSLQARDSSGNVVAAVSGQ